MIPGLLTDWQIVVGLMFKFFVVSVCYSRGSRHPGIMKAITAVYLYYTMLGESKSSFGGAFSSGPFKNCTLRLSDLKFGFKSKFKSGTAHKNILDCESTRKSDLLVTLATYVGINTWIQRQSLWFVVFILSWTSVQWFLTVSQLFVVLPPLLPTCPLI